MMKTGIIYKVTNRINGKCYIGQTRQSLSQRKGDHFKAIFNKKDSSYNCHFYRAIRKYGKENFKWEILARGIPIDCLNAQEINEIARHDTFSNGYNSNSGGGNAWEVSAEVRKKLSIANTGRVFSEEHRRKLSEARKKRVTKDETRQKMSETHSGQKHHMYGKHHSAETIKKMSEIKMGKKIPEGEKAKHGRPHTEEWKRKHSVAMTGKNNPMHGKRLSDEAISRMATALKGRALSEEHKRNISLGLLKFNRGSEVTAIS